MHTHMRDARIVEYEEENDRLLISGYQDGATDIPAAIVDFETGEIRDN